MKIMTALFGPTDAIERAALLREAGASGVFTFEGPFDVFTPLVLASTVKGLDSMSNVAIAFPRNPIQLAHQANDLQLLTEGRFILGLGTQVRAQIEKRYGAAFDRPVERMKEMVGALRAIFAAWNEGERLDFRGEFYRHTLMTPTFVPGPNPFGPPPIYLGALGPRLTRATAEVADGLLVMPFGSKRFLHGTTMPAVRDGLAAAGRSEDDFEVVPEIIVSVATGSDDDHASTRMLLAFYGSTPAYRPVLDAHGWGDLQPELNAMSKQGRWQEMATLIDDEILHTIAACGSPAEVADHIRDRVDSVSDRLCLYQPGPIAVDALAEIVDALS
ncbi:TIGR03617 family F420-dependent LLM class oxidoreductase [Mycolicibacterium austroafricanum]|uniref:TIGR03617 family F420-dependent LLM class oxidoreductase n=1 Tax=Mycolicibacterium austroafricanum TaxID=39687 RepID=A0ABT8HMS6_MYCAO|nr:TIGR03617 family F420-dependent LLM class oxidoreductase [Mycolicibacterium austroafricanum]MDN4522055.1 TIGR03617 family F420-dependent LLM class oxidoreductase [Mycolicibacterium austroafricanum]QRZ08450.1 TIGR03617 family F420-dependent LLM class oxidoreductase [Mycolicibacterium austroafricanum]QZT70102.1 TIGR03617 family F420-dependent LLM class oxidoreductase [Mycolicibacterium austroafricanum]